MAFLPLSFLCENLPHRSILPSFHVCSQFSSAGTPFANVAPPAHPNDPLVTLVPRSEQPGAACDRPGPPHQNRRTGTNGESGIWRESGLLRHIFASFHDV